MASGVIKGGIGEVKTATLYAASLPNDGASTTVAILQGLTKGVWLITAKGLSPLHTVSGNNIVNQPSAFDVIETTNNTTITCTSLFYKFNCTGVVEVSSALDVVAKVTNWESAPDAQASTNYTLKAVRIA